jgi:hypothetical protein
MIAIVEVAIYMSLRETMSECLSMQCSKDKAKWRCGERTHLNCRIIIQALIYQSSIGKHLFSRRVSVRSGSTGTRVLGGVVGRALDTVCLCLRLAATSEHDVDPNPGQFLKAAGCTSTS